MGSLVAKALVISVAYAWVDNYKFDIGQVMKVINQNERKVKRWLDKLRNYGTSVS